MIPPNLLGIILHTETYHRIIYPSDFKIERS